MILSGTDVRLFTLPILPLFTPSAQDVCFYDHKIFFRSSSGVPVTRRSPSKRPEEGPLPVSRGPGLAYHFSTSLSSTITTLSFSYVKNTKIHRLTYGAGHLVTATCGQRQNLGKCAPPWALIWPFAGPTSRDCPRFE